MDGANRATHYPHGAPKERTLGAKALGRKSIDDRGTTASSRRDAIALEIPRKKLVSDPNSKFAMFILQFAIFLNRRGF